MANLYKKFKPKHYNQTTTAGKSTSDNELNPWKIFIAYEEEQQQTLSHISR